ncbi:MAG: hypothetical protein O3C27_10190 [Actinomycetota bacterium]|nr:hypothetical protein [Actinomycetota bacterium]
MSVHRNTTAFLWREKRARSGWGVTALSALIVMMGVVALGAWWVAQAVQDGDPAGTLLRFLLTSVAGTYHLVLFRTARSQRR